MRKVFLLILFVLTGCDQIGFQTLEANQSGIIFSALPRWIGGGVNESENAIIQSGRTVLLFPWHRLYRFNTARQSVGWGAVGQGTDSTVEDYVQTRAADGNEVGLAMTVLYQVDASRLAYIVQNVGVDDGAIQKLVETVARADIRTYMNHLRTQEFFNQEIRENAVSMVAEQVRRRLEPEGIFIRGVIYNDHRFERRLPDGTVDTSYQEQIDQAQALKQQTQQEVKKVATVTEQKRREFNEAQARVNRVIEEAEGFKQQSSLRGDSYLASKKNEAEQITAVGMAEVEGLKKQIAALSGPGGKALLRLDVARALVQKRPNFVLMNSSGGEKGGIDVSRIDANELMRDAGVFQALQESGKRQPRGEPAKPQPQAALEQNNKSVTQ